MKEQPRIRAQRGGEASGRRAFGRGVCGLFLCAVLVMTSACVTRKVWNWAGEGNYAFLPSRVTSLGLAREEGSADRLFVRVDAERASQSQAQPPNEGAPGIETKSAGEYYVLEVPPEWKDQPKVLVPDDIQPGDLQLEDMLAAKLIRAPPDATLASLTPIPLNDSRRFPALDAAPYAFIEGPPGILFIYGADTERGRWVRLASVITGEVITTSAPKSNYAIAVIATPATVAVDAVGVVIYAILWPLWSSMDIGYGDAADDGGYRPDGRYQPGRPQRELEKPRTSPEKPAAPPPLPPRPEERE